MIRTIDLSDGCTMVIDSEDYSMASAWSWRCTHIGTYHQPRAWIAGSAGRYKTSIGRYLLDAPTGVEVDHINGDPLDNRRANLRVVDKKQNQWNQHNVRGRIGFKGVSWDNKRQCYVGRIRDGIHCLYLGNFAEAEWAARAYDRAAFDQRGAYAKLDFPNDLANTQDIAAHRLHRLPIGPARGKSLYRGVSWRERAHKWRSNIYVRGTKVELGYFVTELDAAKAYDQAIDRYGLNLRRKNF